MLSAAYNYWEKLPPESRTSFRFHHISTDEVFGSLGPTGLFTEDTPYVSRLPYSASKAASDHLVSAWLLRAGDVSNKQVTDIAFGVEQRLADHALYGRDAGHDDPVPAHFIEQQSR